VTSLDINGPVACTLRSSTIAEPFYGYLPSDDKEVDVFHPAAIVVMAVDNLPCELPRMLVKALAPCLWSLFLLFLMTIRGVLARAK
jgi:hypothetical protein